MMARCAAILLAMLWVLTGRVEGAGAPPSAFGVPIGTLAGQQHGWTLQFDAELKDWILIHIPPRNASGEVAVESGMIRGVQRLAASPAQIVAMAGVDDAVYLLFDEMREGKVARWVMLRRAVAAGAGYAYEPATRFAATPVLDAAGPIVGFAGTMWGPAICTGGSELKLQVLFDDAWRTIDVPREIKLSPTLQLVADQRGGVVFVDLMQGTVQTLDIAPEKDALRVARCKTVRMGAMAVDAQPWHAEAVVGDEVLVSRETRERRLELGRMGLSGLRVLNQVPGAPAAANIVPIPAGGRVVALWNVLETSATAPAKQHTELVEMSIHTGSVLYQGPARRPAPLDAGDMRALVAILIMVMASILYVLLRPVATENEVHLPERASLAEAGRRALATLIDVLIAGFVVLKSWDMALGDMASPEVWLSMRGVELLIGTLLTGFILSCGAEFILGRSLGKLMTGCEVISVLAQAPERQNRPVFRQTLVRNLVKWLLPPVALSVLFDTSLRHRGDLIAGTAVVVWEPEEDGDEME